MMKKKLPAWRKAGAATLVVMATGLAVACGLEVSEAESTRQDADRTDLATVALRVEGMT